MKTDTKLEIGIAAMLVVGVLLVQGGTESTQVTAPEPSRTVAPASTPVRSASPAAAAEIPPLPLPAAGELAVGSYAFTPLPTNVVGGLTISTRGWSSRGDDPGLRVSITKGTLGTPGGAWIRISTYPVEVYADPCRHVPQDWAGSLDDLATAITAIPGTDPVDGPWDLTSPTGRAPLVLTVRDDIPCDPRDFYLWTDRSAGPRAATATRATIRVWVPWRGDIPFIDAETYQGVSPALEQEIEEIVGSVYGGG
jgi:hypothetical protein